MYLTDYDLDVMHGRLSAIRSEIRRNETARALAAGRGAVFRARERLDSILIRLGDHASQRREQRHGHG